jgi:glyoxylase-like metal-dependent hydrolase (beta-lactamase superfamily II)
MKAIFAVLCGALVLTLQTAMAQNVNVIERNGVRMYVYLSKPVVFQVASVVLETEKEVALVDAQFSADNARAVADLIRATGKPLTTIFVSHYDPDYYFGLDVIATAFPKAKIVATPQTVWMIEATQTDKMAVWAPQLGDLAPKKPVVPTPLAGDNFTVGNLRVEVRSRPGDESHSWLWIPNLRTILGGVYLNDGQHLWVADSPTPDDRQKWIAALDAMKALNPALVIPAHFAPRAEAKPGVVGSDPIGFTRRYLTTLESTMAGLKTAADVIARMKTAYPGLPGESSLEMTARVLKGETPWKVVRPFPVIGRKAEVDFGGEYLFELSFADNHTMTFRGLRPRAAGRPVLETVRYTAVEVAPQVYMVYWTEKDNTRVVHVEDFAGGVVYTNIAAPDGSFTNLRGTLKLI